MSLRSASLNNKIERISLIRQSAFVNRLLFRKIYKVKVSFLIRLAIFLARGRAYMKLLYETFQKLGVGSILGHIAFCRLG